MKRVVLCACLFCLYPAFAQAEKTVYVIDQITITLRAGQGTQHQILRTLPSGTPMEVLRVNEESGYSQVRTKDGIEGWVLSQYLIDEPTSKLKLTAAEQKLTRLDAESKDLKAKYEQLLKEKERWDKDLKALSGERDKLSAEIAKPREASPEVAQPPTADTSTALPAGKETEMLRQENQVLKDRAKKDWFIAGAGVMLIGIVLGLLVSRLRLRRSSWGGDTL
ncbi:MAG: TIGR04211 family SH3 domain-containing protein [Gammaproteobacteria bacterium]|nr:TIGR04211 family SH3 domain-containing protein [Gammaproteobacteria bacterium]